MKEGDGHQTKMQGTQLQERKEVPGTSVVRRDVPRKALPHARERVRHPSDGTRTSSGRSQSMEEARDWERLFIGEIKAGRDPRRPSARTIQAGSELRDVVGVPRRLRRAVRETGGAAKHRGVRSRVGVLKEHLGELPLTALEEPDEINQFKTDSEYAEDVEIATMHRVLETLRAAMNWGMAQTPPLFNIRRSTDSACG